MAISVVVLAVATVAVNTAIVMAAVVAAVAMADMAAEVVVVVNLEEVDMAGPNAVVAVAVWLWKG